MFSEIDLQNLRIADDPGESLCSRAANEIERLRALLLNAKDALYNPFESDNQCNTYKAIDAALK